MLNYRYDIYFSRGDVTGCRDATAAYEKLPLTFPWYPYNTARFRCRLATMLKDRPDEVRIECDRAIEQLRRAAQTGQYDRSIWDKQPDIEPIRNRDDYRTLIESLPAKK